MSWTRLGSRGRVKKEHSTSLHASTFSNHQLLEAMAALRLITPTLLKTQLGCTGLNLRLATATRVVVPRSRLPSLTSARAFSVAPALAHAHSHSNSKSDGSRGPVTAALALFGITLAGGSGLFKKPAEAGELAWQTHA